VAVAGGDLATRLIDGVTGHLFHSISWLACCIYIHAIYPNFSVISKGYFVAIVAGDVEVF
jgi:hypothetical protein